MYEPHPDMIAARLVQRKHHLNKTCQAMWSRLGDLKMQLLMPGTEEIQEQMQNKVADFYHWKPLISSSLERIF